ncbi:MAG: GyrI-like domain-containing protein [Desulfotomaculaceae bacterium]
MKGRADAPFTAYYNLDMQDLDVEMGFPVMKPLPGNGEIISGEIPRGKYVSCMYKGAYSQMERPYNEMFKWIEENGYEQKGVYYEYYYNSPHDVPESELLTRISMLLK